MQHHQHPSAAATDASGWVESIGSLNDEHPATALLLGTPPAAASVQNGASKPGSSTSNSAADHTGVAAVPAAAPAGSDLLAADNDVQLSPEQEFEASLEHGLGVMMAEVGMQY